MSPRRVVKRPESVLVVIHSGAEVLLLHRRPPFDFWQSVTGSMEWHETDPRLTAKRELFEETGLAVELAPTASPQLVDLQLCQRFIIDPRWRHRYADDAYENVEHAFSLELAAPCLIRLDTSEHDRYQWLPVEQAMEQLWSETNRRALAALFAAKPPYRQPSSNQR